MTNLEILHAANAHWDALPRCQKARAFEERVTALLEAQGWTVTPYGLEQVDYPRSQAIKNSRTPAHLAERHRPDLKISHLDGRKYLAECKSGNWISEDSWNELGKLKGIPVVIISKDNKDRIIGCRIRGVEVGEVQQFEKSEGRSGDPARLITNKTDWVVIGK